MAAGAVSAPLIIPIMHLQTRQAKNHINTNTPVSIHSDSPGVQIFYSLDGSKPSAGQRGATGSSRKYNEPIQLPAGRVTVRALAVTSDGRQSSTVTKVFSVDLVDPDRKQNDLNFLQTEQQNASEGTCWSAESAKGSSLRPPEPRIMGKLSPKPGPRFLSRRLDPPGPPQRPLSASPAELKELSSTARSRVCRETDHLRCSGCLNLRPSDPFARFCSECGSAVPEIPEQRRPPPAEGGQMVSCVFCHTLVPVNTHTCLVCEASLRQSSSLQGHVVCVCCGSGNPAHVSSCLTCESGLSDGAPCGPSDYCRSTCSRCARSNRSDARFCDWCGAKRGHAVSCVTCWRCGASGHPHAIHCAACGILLDAPAPPTSSCDVKRVGGVATKEALKKTTQNAPRQATPLSDPTHTKQQATPTTEQSTQTVGLYYPSATGLQRREEQRALQLKRQNVTRDRQPPQTAISPGRGFWRKQLDHVCSHLRSYAQNHAPFRTLLGEPRLGRMVSAVVQEDQYEVSLTVSFVSAGRETDKQVDQAGDGLIPSGGTETLSSVTERSADTLRSDRPTVVMKPKLAPKPAVKDVQLVKALGPGEGHIQVVQQLLDQGAEPSCCDSDGRHALALAVMNGHHDVLPVLVQRGADVDQQSGAMKNTALHEAAARGADGLESAKVLLRWLFDRK